MKILELRFKNLNSLYGEWTIDFTNAEFVSNGIFALTGPTGAGKSTILDAICLALYGATPRLGRIVQGRNEIMSRQTSDCYAEVLFESQAGRFRCQWQNKRARGKIDGNLQDPTHEIIDVATDKLIETNRNKVLKLVIEKTGMDFDRFTRSILLAQGGFDTFLKADVEQKSKILEQITGTEIYTEISKMVHLRKGDEEKKLEVLRAETSGIKILDEAEEKQKQEKLELEKKQEAKLIGKTSEAEKAITWLTNIELLNHEIVTLNEEATKLEVKISEFKPEQTKLEQAIKAASLDGKYATLTALRKEQHDDQNSLKTDEESFPELESSASTQLETLKVAEQLTVKTKEERNTAAPLIQKIRSIDQKIAEQTKTLSGEENASANEARKIEADKQALAKEHEKKTAAEKKLKVAEVYIKENARDEWLISGLAGVEEQLANLLAKQRETAQKEIELKKADSALVDALKKLEATAKQCGLNKQELEAAVKNLNQGKDKLSELLGEKLLREYRAEKDNLLREMAFIRKIEELEDYRSKLEDGKPCPLCGSNEHPFAEGNVPAHDETEQKIESLTQLINKAEECEAVIKKLEQAEVAARQNLNESERLETEATNEKKSAENRIAELKRALAELQTVFDDIKSAISLKLQPLGITEIPEEKVESLLDSLRSRLKAWQKQIEQKTDIERQIAAFDSEVKRLDAVIDTQRKALTKKREHLEVLKNELVSLTEERKQLYGGKNPDDEERRLNKAIADAENAEVQARDQRDELQQKLTRAKTKIESLQKRISDRKPLLHTTETGFSTSLTEFGFADENSFLDARLSQQVRESLSAQAKKLDNDKIELNAKQKDRETRLKTEISKKLTDKTLAELEPQFEDFSETLKTLRDNITTLRYELTENTKAKERVQGKRAQIEAQEKEFRRWKKLHELIGSNDGKKYRKFAQGLTFELMVSHANRQLQKMNDRYLLIPNEKEGLELDVIDNYQAGEIRSTKNLSGGESFIVSLTLALGLSKMASQKVRVDSLFLDEGFGTLDEEALEMALEALSGLHQEGKLIGIISHITVLKERISTQISVTPKSGGRSSLSGPGCKHVV